MFMIPVGIRSEKGDGAARTENYGPDFSSERVHHINKFATV
jgi:hypothetical protein